MLFQVAIMLNSESNEVQTGSLIYAMRYENFKLVANHI